MEHNKNNNNNPVIPNEIILYLILDNDLPTWNQFCAVSREWRAAVRNLLIQRFPEIINDLQPGPNRGRRISARFFWLLDQRLFHLAALVLAEFPEDVRPSIGKRVWTCPNCGQNIPEDEIEDYVNRKLDATWCDSLELRVEDASFDYNHECQFDESSDSEDDWRCYEQDIKFNLRMVLETEASPDGDEMPDPTGEFYIVDAEDVHVLDLRRERSQDIWEQRFKVNSEPEEDPYEEFPEEPDDDDHSENDDGNDGEIIFEIKGNTHPSSQ